MKAVHLCEIDTPKGFRLDGIWFGPKRAKRVIILIHGLGGNMLNSVAHSFTDALVDANTAVLSFNNRGYGIVSKIYKSAPKTKKGYTRIIAGAAHEKFEECVDDIDGAVRYVKKHVGKEVYLAGHSTGCQKSIYWASRDRAAGVSGIILLAPVSDYAGMSREVSEKKIARATEIAKKMVKTKRGHELMSPAVWPEMVDAQRFVSLYSKKGNEEIFTYWDPAHAPKLLRSVRLPVLAVLAEKDEYWDRPVGEIADWFLEHLFAGEVAVIPEVAHSFHGGQKMVARAIGVFMKERYN
jgi:pimeloyl-ACP methyl ester carboxylesterase